MSKNKEKDQPVVCPCGSRSFIQAGLANFREEITASTSEAMVTINGGDPELDIISSHIKCASCGAEAEW